jgi:hypothetical protein
MPEGRPSQTLAILGWLPARTRDILIQRDEGDDYIAERFLTRERIRWNGCYWESYN